MPPPSSRATDQHAQQIVDQASDAIFIYDLEGRCVDSNKAACLLVGYTSEELLGLRIGDIDPSLASHDGPQRWREMAVGESATIEGVNCRNDHDDA